MTFTVEKVDEVPKCLVGRHGPTTFCDPEIENLESDPQLLENNKDLQGQLDKRTFEVTMLENKLKTAKDLLDKEILDKNLLKAERLTTKTIIVKTLELVRCNQTEEASHQLESLVNQLTKPVKRNAHKDYTNFLEFENSVAKPQDISLTSNTIESSKDQDSTLNNKNNQSPIIKKESNDGFCEDKENTKPTFGSLILASPMKEWNFCYGRSIPGQLAPPRRRAPGKLELFDHKKILKYNVVSSTPDPNQIVLNEINSFHNGHSFSEKYICWNEKCQSCGARLAFGKVAYRCSNCKSYCHFECMLKLPLPCVISTPEHAFSKMNKLEYYTPPTSPMVPSLVVHCTYEVELRGLTNSGIYRISGSSKDINSLRESFRKRKGLPILTNIDIHVVCCTLKQFLRSLDEPLLTRKLWPKFIQAHNNCNLNEDQISEIYDVIDEMPQPNRDTLAWMMRHLQIVSRSPYCQMPAENLAKVFGPTIIGYCGKNSSNYEILRTTNLQNDVLLTLLKVPTDHWNRILKPLALLRHFKSELVQN